MTQSTIPASLSTYQPQINAGNPWNAWLVFQLGGLTCPGTIVRGGIKGFKKRTGWDAKAGKGTAGGTMTIKGLPLCKGSITVQLLTQQDQADLDSFIAAVCAITPSDQSADGLSFYHPSIPWLTAVVIGHPGDEGGYTPYEYDKGKLLWTIDLTEWRPPVATSVVATPASVAPEQDNGVNQPAAVDPRIAAKEAELQAVSTNAANTLGRAAGQ